MAQLQPVRGTHDLLPDDARRHAHVVHTARRTAALYGFQEISLPIFEFTEVFKRTLGETSDIVSKEMYTFEDRGGDQLTLRPEATAGVARAFISGGLQQSLPLKFFVSGPMFRYERPQKGRLRQFHQIDVEILGVDEPQADIEVIAVGAHILDELEIRDATMLELNTLGDAESRAVYRDALVAFLEDRRDRLSEDSRDRLTRNPLRILDSKDAADREIIADAPVYTDYLNDRSREFFDRVRQGLDDLGIEFEINPRLVRGLDYYCHTAFEFTTDRLGAQGAVIAGGRYDGLIAQMGGPDTPGIGWAGGIERLAMLAQDAPAPPRPVAFVPIGAEAERRSAVLASSLRRAGIAVDVGYRGNLSRRMKRANRIGARFAVIVGDDELNEAGATVRDLDSGEQDSVPFDRLVDFFTQHE
ncbi:MAG: histidine--tRNA ligase [Alphaproteobacteria bacterium]|nr:histidine--tRNA ligase [Alphaproteobacteria bacterium]